MEVREMDVSMEQSAERFARIEDYISKMQPEDFTSLRLLGGLFDDVRFLIGLAKDNAQDANEADTARGSWEKAARQRGKELVAMTESWVNAQDQLEKLQQDVRGVLHQLETGEASDGDVDDVAWCARALRAALGEKGPATLHAICPDCGQAVEKAGYACAECAATDANYDE